MSRRDARSLLRKPTPVRAVSSQAGPPRRRAAGARALLAVGAAMSALLAAGNAHAQTWHAGVVGRATVGYTDNIRAASGDLLAGDMFYRLRPGAQAFLQAPRGTVSVGYFLDVLIFQQNSGNNALTHTVLATAQLETSERGRLEMDADANVGQTNNISLLGEPESGAVGFVPAGENSFRNLGVQQRFRWQASETITLSQTSGLRTFDTTLDGRRLSSVLSAQAGVGATYAGDGDTWDALTNVRYLEFDAADGIADDDDFVDVSGLVRWRRVLSPSVVAAVQAGAALALGPDADFESRLRLLAGAEVAYYERWGGAALAYRRNSDPNLFLGITSVTDSITARGFLPLVGRQNQRASLTLATSIGRQWGEGLDFDTGMQRGEWTTSLADVALLWTVRREVEASIRYQFTDQNGDGDVLPDYQRNAVFVEIVARYGGPPPEAPSVAVIAEREVEDEAPPAEDVE